MRPSRVAALSIIAAIALVACGEDDVDIRQGPSTSMLADSAVLAQMRSVDTVGRIIYEPAPDLSLASARQRRPDIFRPPAPAATPRAAPKDTARPQAAAGARNP